jgi:serine/threonine-protein kinase
MILLATVITARMSRRTTLLALGELESAVRVAAHREALLLEAREELERALRPGRGRFSDQIIGGYTLGALLGRGAMGEVYEAQAVASSKLVAIKVLAQASLGNPTHVLRFLRELRTAATIISPYVVRVIEVGEKPVPYLVMERLDGQSLSEILRGRRAFSAEEAIELARHVGKGITAAAQAGIVHRDLKPQNIFRDRDTWKVLDFGVARAIDQGDTLTKGDVVGTPSYMAPEQASGSSATHACDLYALAAILYRAITGQPPYAGGEIAETLYRVVNTRPPRPSDVAPVSANIDLVLAIGMARAPEDRFTTADEFTAAIEAAFANALSPKLIARARDLERAGGWAPSRRQSTAPTKVPRGSA